MLPRARMCSTTRHQPGKGMGCIMMNSGINGSGLSLRAAGRRALGFSAIAPVIFALSASPATAQPSSPVTTSAPVVAPEPVAVLAPPAETKLYQGTPVSMRLLRELTTKNKALKVGDRFDLELVDPLKLGSVTVIPSGTRGVGEIMSVRNKGMWGKSGHFDARLMHLRVGDRLIRLSGSFDDKGTAGGWGASAVSVLTLPVLGFFMTGTSAKVEAGAIIKGALDEDVPFLVSAAQQSQPLMVAPSTTN